MVVACECYSERDAFDTAAYIEKDSRVDTIVNNWNTGGKIKLKKILNLFL